MAELNRYNRNYVAHKSVIFTIIADLTEKVHRPSV